MQGEVCRADGVSVLLCVAGEPVLLAYAEVDELVDRMFSNQEHDLARPALGQPMDAVL